MTTFIREVWNHDDRFFARSLVIFFLLTILFYLGLIIYALNTGQYSFVHDDEFNYVAAAKLFSETGSVRAPLCMLEDVSKIFGANWYGISYNIFYGTLYKIFGEYSIIFIIMNVVFIALSFLLILKLHISSYDKTFAMEMLLLSYPFMIYTFMFFPEILHIFLALLQFFLLFRIYQIHASGGNYRRPLILFITLSVLFSMFRVTSVFWIAGVLPFCKNKKHFFFLLIIFLAAVVLVMTYMHYFVAPAFVYSMDSIESLKQFKISEFWNMWSKYVVMNTSNLLTLTIKEPQVLILLLLYLYTACKSVISKNRLFLGATLICSCYLFTLISFYNTYPFYFTKQTAVLYPLLICSIAFLSPLAVRKFAVACFVVALPFSISTASDEISLRKKAGYELETTYAPHVAELQKIATLVNQQKRNLIEFVHYEHKYPRYIFYDALPLCNGNHFPITYTASINNETLYPGMNYNERFPRYGTQDIDYIISRDSVHLYKVDLIYHSPYYFLYRDNR